MDGPGDAGTLIHYGGDSGVTAVYRKGTLHFYNNTVVVEIDQQQYYNTTLLEPDTNAEGVDLYNNILYTQSATPGATPTQFNLVKSYGTVHVGTNWISPGWLVSSAYGGFQGTISGTLKIIPSASSPNDPGFVNSASNDFHLRSSSAAIDKSQPLDAAATAAGYTLSRQYIVPHSSEPRVVHGVLDLGAFELAGKPTVTSRAHASLNPVTGTSTALSVLGSDSGGEASLSYTWTTKGPLPAVTFSDNGTNTAKHTTATFSKASTWSPIADNTNSGQNLGNGVYVEEYSRITVKNSLFWGNTEDFYIVPDKTGSRVAVRYSDTQQASAGISNVSKDPLFADPAAGDYHEKSTSGRWDPAAQDGAGGWVVDTVTSPTIDAGDPASGYSLETAPNGGRINMGVYGNTAQASRSPASH